MVLDEIVESMKPLGADVSGERASGVRRSLDRRVREPGQAKRCVLGAGVRRASVHAAELQRHARFGVHAGARDGPLDAHDAGRGPSAVRVLRLHDLRCGSSLDAERDAVLSTICCPARPISASGSCFCSTPSTTSSGRSIRQCLFADYELQAHRLAEQGEPITAEVLSRIYFDLFKAYHGDAMTYDDAAQITWARVPHFFGSPYYVYQYATCYASSAQLIQQITSGERR